MRGRSSLVQRDLVVQAPDKGSRIGPLVWLIILLPFVVLPSTWIVGGRALPTKWYAFGILTLIVAALIVIFRNSRAFHLTLLAFTIGLEIDIHLSYLQSDSYVSASGYYLSIALVPLAALYATWIWHVVTGRERFAFRKRLLLPLALFFAFALFSITRAQEAQLARWELASLVYCLLIFFYMANNVRSRNDLRLIVWGLALSAAAQGMLAIAQFATGSSLGLEVLGEAGALMRETASEGAVSRASGTLGHPNSLAMYLAFLMPLLLGAVLTAGNFLRRLVFTGIFLIAATAMIATLSRGGMLVSIAVLPIFLLLWGRKAGKFGIVSSVLLVSVALAALLLTALGNPLTKRFLEDRYETAHVRLPLMGVAARMIESNLLFGVGLNNYTQTAGDYDYTLERVTSEMPRPVHNMYMLLLAEIGVFGFLAFLAFLLGMLAKGFGSVKVLDPELATYSLALTMGMAAVLLHGFVDFFYPSMNFTFWFIAGSIVGLHILSRELTQGTLLSRTGSLL